MTAPLGRLCFFVTAAIAAAAIANACDSGSDQSGALTLDREMLEQALLTADSVPGGWASLESEPPGDIELCEPLPVVASTIDQALFRESSQGGAYVSERLLAYTGDDAKRAFAYLANGREECDGLERIEYDEVGDEAALFSWDYNGDVPTRHLIWRRENVLVSLFVGTEIDRLDELAEDADQRLAQALEDHGQYSDDPAPTATPPMFDLEIEAFERFDLYWLGEEFADLPLTQVIGGRSRRESVGVLYGDCYVPVQNEGGCGLPVSIQIWPACERHLAKFQPPVSSNDIVEVRGVPALDRSASQLEIYTDNITIVIFATDAIAVAEALRSVDGAVEPGEDLPAPLPNHLEGGVRCPR